MQLPSGAQGPVVHVPTADGVNVLGGDAAHPMYMQLASRLEVGAFFATLAATQTATGTQFGAAVGMGYVAKRAGSVTGFSAELDAAITGAGTTVTAKVYKNGVLVDASLNLAFTQAGAQTKLDVVVANGSFNFVAGDVITVVYDSTGITNTPHLTATVELTIN